MSNFTFFILPSVILIIVLFGFIKGIKVFDCFLEGAKGGLQTFANLLPPLVGLVVGVAMLRASGALDLITSLTAPIADFLGIPREVMPLTILSPISGSGSLTMFESILSDCGPDSAAGRVASVIMGSTETTFYAVTVYYGSVGIRKTRGTVPAAMLADFAGYFSSAMAVRLLFPGG